MMGRDKDVKGMRPEEAETLEPELREALGNFKASVDTWSDAMIGRPRKLQAPESTPMNWGLLAKWALGCAVFVATLSGGVYENHRQHVAAQIEAARVAEQQRQLAAQKAKDQSADDLMAKVDSDIERQVPQALEPLEALMNQDQSNAGN